MTALSDTNTMLTADQISEANEIVLENTFVKEPMRMDMEAHGHLLTITFDDKPATPKDKPEIKDNAKMLSRTFTGALRLIDNGANMAPRKLTRRSLASKRLVHLLPRSMARTAHSKRVHTLMLTPKL